MIIGGIGIISLFPDVNGFTLFELIMVMVIVGILSSIVVPKFTRLSDSANGAKCVSNRDAIVLALTMTYVTILIYDPTLADWLEDAGIEDLNDTMFATGSVPICRTTGTFTISSGLVTCNVYGS